MNQNFIQLLISRMQEGREEISLCLSKTIFKMSIYCLYNSMQWWCIMHVWCQPKVVYYNEKKNFLKILHECVSIAASVFASSWLIISLLHLSSSPLENATASNQGKMHINWKLKNCAFGLELRPRKASKKTMKTFDLIFSVTSIEWIKVWKAVQISSDPRTGSEKHEKLLVDITTLWNFNPPSSSFNPAQL